MTDTDKLAELKQEQARLHDEVKEAGASGDQARINAVMKRVLEVGQEILDLETGETNFGKTHNRGERPAFD